LNDSAYAERLKVKGGAVGDVHSAGVDPCAGHDHRLSTQRVHVTVKLSFFFLHFPMLWFI
jgi:hypothetical protein